LWSRVRIAAVKQDTSAEALVNLALAGIEREVKKALDLEEPLRDEPGNPTGANQHQSPKSQSETLSDKDSKYGTSESYLRRRLARDNPRIYLKVVSGEMKAKEAARQVGIIKQSYVLT
jgi:hypothetical protein